MVSRVSLCLLLSTLALALIPAASAQSFVFSPSTTVTHENANNTSAADGFTAQSNGIAGAGNVSKQPIRSLLYTGATTRTYAHFMPWFGQPNHMDVGYSSDTVEQVKRQVDDMQSRGIQGAIVDWYGPDRPLENNTTLKMMAEVESRSERFEFAIMEDVGALNQCAATAGCDVTQRLIDDLNYASNTYYSSSSYMRLDGRPVVFFFGVDKYVLDWNRVRAGAMGEPLFIFRQTSGFAHKQSDGAFSWINSSPTDPNDEGLPYLDDFYATAKGNPSKYTFGSAYAGFDNSLAPWAATSRKVMKQHCGQTWLDSLERAGKFYDANTQLQALQLVTWNDYEEGTAIETGIENCVEVSASVADNTLSWSITGKENTVDHYTVFISDDGDNLTSLGDVPVGTKTRDLAGLGLEIGKTYQVFVKAVGKASLKNHISAATTFVPQKPLPKAALALSPESGTAPIAVTADTSASTVTGGTIAFSSIDFGDGSAPVSGPLATHKYATGGTYTVTATVTDDAGTTASKTNTLTVNAGPTAALTVTPGSGNAPVTVTADATLSTDADGTIASSTIDFGDGAPAVAGPVATHTYTVAGTYTVTATVKDNVGAASSTNRTVVIKANVAPAALLSVTPASGTAPVTVTANASASTDADGTISSSTINFGDGSPVAAGPVASHTYTTANTYTITATVKDNLGATSTASKTVAVSAPLVAPSTTCKGSTTNRTITVCAPVANGTYTTSVRVWATATDPNPMANMQVYVDGVLKYTKLNAKSVDKVITMSVGTRKLTVQAKDAAGTFKTSFYIKVR